jgi:ubiquinone/menaquinone biosynthesis C-methylase UbiE
MTSEQRSIFLNSEGNEWFVRNHNVASEARAQDLEHIFSSLQDFKSNITNILEIGCADGFKTKRMADFFGANGSGIDPSELAVQEANAVARPGMEFRVGTAENLPFENSSFDLVYFGFCLYLIDRDLLYKSIAEADRVLRPGGFLAITDFDAKRPSKTPYRHKAGVMSYRNDYSGIFLSSGHFTLVSKCSFSHIKPTFDSDSKERVSSQILFKEIEAYPEL